MNAPPLETSFSFQRDGLHLGAPSLQAHLAAVFNLKASREHIQHIKLSSAKATVRKAQQLDDYLDALLDDQGIKKELLGMLASNKGVAFMGVATLTLMDAELAIMSSDKREDAGELKAEGVMTAAGLPPIPASIAANYKGTQELFERQKIDGRKIFGIEYYKITKASFWKKANTVNMARGPTEAGRLGVYGDNRQDDDKDLIDTDISDISFERVQDQMREDIPVISVDG
jgi:hypothetical protein